MPPPRDPSGGAGTPPAVHRAYRDLGIVGYLLYGVGAVSPFIRDALHLSDTQTGLHSSLLALGLLGAGMVADRLDHRAGPSRVHTASALVAALAVALLAWAPALAVTLAAAAMVGLSCGVFLGHVNDLLGSAGGTESRLRLVRANLFAMVGPFVVPLAIALGIALGLGWQLVFLPSLALLAWSIRDARHFGIPLADRPAATGHLPRAYWLGWLMLVLVISVEFSAAFWGSTLVQRRTGVPLGDAALAAGGFFAGMLLGRAALSLERIGGIDPRRLVRGGLVLAIIGSLAAWVAGDPVMAAAALFVTGVGVSGQYPLGAALTLPLGAAAPAAAAARLTLASGLAVLVAPLVLGAAADLVGVERAWLLIPALALAALLLTGVLARGPAGAPDAVPAAAQ